MRLPPPSQIPSRSSHSGVPVGLHRATCVSLTILRLNDFIRLAPWPTTKRDRFIRDDNFAFDTGKSIETLNFARVSYPSYFLSLYPCMPSERSYRYDKAYNPEGVLIVSRRFLTSAIKGVQSNRDSARGDTRTHTYWQWLSEECHRGLRRQNLDR